MRRTRVVVRARTMQELGLLCLGCADDDVRYRCGDGYGYCAECAGRWMGRFAVCLRSLDGKQLHED